MLIVETYLSPSKIHGIGLFANQFIPQGTIVYKYEEAFTKSYSQQELLRMRDDKFAKRILMKHAWKRGDMYIISLDDDRFTNHSDEPNTHTIGDDTFASIDIHKGEEITGNYNHFYEQGSDFERIIECLA